MSRCLFFFICMTFLITNSYSGSFADTHKDNALIGVNNFYLVKKLNLGGVPSAVYSSDNLAFLACDSVIDIIDISNPETPTIINQYILTSIVISMSGFDDYLLVSTEDNDITILKIDDSTNLISLGHINDSDIDLNNVIKLIYSNGVLFTLDEYGFINIFDITELSEATFLYQFDSPLQAKDMLIYGNYLYIADYPDQLCIFDISEVNSPQIINSIQIGFCNALCRYNNYLFVSTFLDNMIRCFDISNPEIPQLINEFSTGWPGYTFIQSIGLLQDIFYIVISINEPQGVRIYSSQIDHVFNCSDISGFSSVWFYNSSACHFSADSLLLVSNRLDRLKFYGIGENNNIIQISELITGGDIKDAKIKDSLLVVRKQNGEWIVSFSFYNINDIANPSIIGHFIDGPYSGQDFWQYYYARKWNIQDNILIFTFGGSYSMKFVDISSLETPEIINTYDPQNIYSIKAFSTYNDVLYLAGNSNIEIINMSDPANLISDSTLTLNGEIKDLYYFDSLLVLLKKIGSNYSVEIFDATNPFEIESIGEINTNPFGHIFFKKGNLILYENSNVVVYEINKNGDSNLIGEYTASGDIVDVDVSDNYVYLMLNSLGMECFDLNTFEQYGYYFNNKTGKIVVKEDFAVITQNNNVLLILSNHPVDVNPEEPLVAFPSEFHIYSNYPNPFNSETKISFSLVYSAPVTIRIFNILGQEIMKLDINRTSIGRNDVLVDMHDSPTGIYYYKIESCGFSGFGKMVLLK